MPLFLISSVFVALASSSHVSEILSSETTADRIRDYGYPVEEHTVQTTDGYLLTMFRIPYSNELKNEDDSNKPVIFLMHALGSASDNFILNGLDNSLAYLLVDAGYDVWMGNARGNRYSKKHVSLTSMLPAFWDFSWNEIGIYDVPAMIDSILDQTNHDSLHYVGYSQGTTVFMVMLSSLPSYNKKIKTSHMLSPLFYMNNIKSPLGYGLAPLYGEPNLVSASMRKTEMLPHSAFFDLLGNTVCQADAVFQKPYCANTYFTLFGYDPKNLNFTLVPDLVKTTPAGGSTGQLIHYVQEYESGHFRKYDYGLLKNLQVYGRVAPPDYSLKNIQPAVPIQIYYGDNDLVAAVEDVERFAKQLGPRVELHHIELGEWNHLDFVYAKNAKEVIYDRLIGLTNDYENEYENK